MIVNNSAIAIFVRYIGMTCSLFLVIGFLLGIGGISLILLATISGIQ